jgi:hypothetical protein
MKYKLLNCEPRLRRDWVFKDPRRRTRINHPLSSLKDGRADDGDPPILASRPVNGNINFA